MQTKIHHEFWADEKLEDAPSEVKLAILWMLTNSRMSHIGYCRISAKRFSFETGLDAEWIGRACDTLAMGIVRTSEGVYFRHFLRWQFATGKKGGQWWANKILIGSYALIMGIGCPSVGDAFKVDYPELYELELKRSKSDKKPSPSDPHGMGEGEGEGERERGSEEGGPGETPPPDLEPGEAVPKSAELERAKAEISKFYGHRGRWTYQDERELYGSYQPGDIEVFKAYRTFSEHDEQERKNWPHKMFNLVRAWGSNVARARVYLAENGASPAVTAMPAAAPSKAVQGPEGWQAELMSLFPKSAIPGRWLELSTSVRRDIETSLQNKKSGGSEAA